MDALTTRFFIGLILFGLGIIAGFARMSGNFGDPAHVDGGLIVLLVLLGGGIYLAGSALAMHERRGR